MTERKKTPGGNRGSKGSAKGRTSYRNSSADGLAASFVDTQFDGTNDTTNHVTYHYVDERGEVLFHVRRTEYWHDGVRRKDFIQWPAGGRPGDKVAGVRKVLYRLPEVLAAAQRGDVIYVVEGEKDVHAVEQQGAVATCNPGGAGKWRPEYTEALRGAKVIIVQDRDGPGRNFTGEKHATKVLLACRDANISAQLKEPLRAEGVKDISDHLAGGHGLDELGVALPHVGDPATPDLAKVVRRSSEAGSGWIATALAKFEGLRDTGDGWEACCPAHDDHTPSLSVAIGDNGGLLLHCHRACPVEDVLDAAGLAWEDLFPPWQDAPTEDAGYAGEVARELARVRIREMAKELYREERADRELSLPPFRSTLTEELAINDGDPVYTVRRLHERGMNSVLVAAYKTGKTTLLGNLFAALLNEEPFLGEFPVTKPEGRVAFWNYEMGERQFRRWLHDWDLHNTEDAVVWNLRGARIPLWAHAGQQAAIEWLRDHKVAFLILDPFARAFAGGGDENSNSDVLMFTDALDAIKREAGVEDLIVSAHTGRGDNGDGFERARGATRLDDWADSRWIFTKEKDGTRYFGADGRDVQVEAGALRFDPATRVLAWSGASKADTKFQASLAEIVAAVSDSPGIGKEELKNAIGGDKNQKPTWIARVVDEQYVRVEMERKKHKHFLTKKGEQYLSRRAVRKGG